MNIVPDHPMIRNLERTGWPDGDEPVYPSCPVCGEPEADYFYQDEDGAILGCSECLHRVEYTVLIGGA